MSRIVISFVQAFSFSWFTPAPLTPRRAGGWASGWSRCQSFNHYHAKQTDRRSHSPQYLQASSHLSYQSTLSSWQTNRPSTSSKNALSTAAPPAAVKPSPPPAAPRIIINKSDATSNSHRPSTALQTCWVYLVARWKRRKISYRRLPRLVYPCCHRRDRQRRMLIGVWFRILMCLLRFGASRYGDREGIW